MHHRPSSGAMNAAGVAAALAERAEQVCRRYLPHGRRQGRYWVAGDLDGARGRSLYVRLHGPGTPGKWTDASVGTHGDLLDIIRHRIDAPTLRAALDEARAFLALPPAPAKDESGTYDAVEAARRLWRLCRAIGGTHAEAYLRARGLARCRFPALRFHPPASPPRRPGGAAPARAGRSRHRRRRRGARGSTHLARSPRAREGRHRFSRKALGRVFGHAVRFGRPGATLLVGEGIETVLSVVTAVPDIEAAAALSAGSLGAFAPPAGVRRLVIARDNDIEGERAAERLARRCARAGVAALTAAPEAGDFNDDLMLLGPAALAAKLGPLFRRQVRDGE